MACVSEKTRSGHIFSKPLISEDIITNPDTKKHYVKGKFLGKVSFVDVQDSLLHEFTYSYKIHLTMVLDMSYQVLISANS